MASARPAPPMKVTKLAAAPAYVLSSPDGVTDWVIVDTFRPDAWPTTTTPLDAMQQSAEMRQRFVDRRDGLRVFVAALPEELASLGIDPKTRMRIR